MPHRLIERIRQKILLRDYDLTIHANEEMAEDDLDYLDLEQAVLSGQVVRRHKRDPRGMKYTIEGLAVNGGASGGYCGPLSRNGSLLIITVYDVNKYH